MRGKKLRDNGIWESSRIILPEHRSAIRQHRTELRKRVRPELDEQRWEELQIAISDAMNEKQIVTVTVWDEWEDVVHHGRIEKVDPIRQLVKLVSDGEVVWIPFKDIMDVKSQVM